MKYGYPIQGVLPFQDLAYSEDGFTDKYMAQAVNDNDAILERNDKTLLFMTMSVSMTSKNEMPIVRAYTGRIPSLVCGIHRVTTHRVPNVAPHFYFDDSRILQYWNNPFKTEKILCPFAVSIGIDFSMTNEMTRPQKMYASFLNKLWVAWLQSRNHYVIPNVSFPDEWLEDYWLEGWPKQSIIAISSVGVMRHGNSEGWLKAVNRIRRELRPVHIIRYGPFISGEDSENCTYFANDNNRFAYGR